MSQIVATGGRVVFSAARAAAPTFARIGGQVAAASAVTLAENLLLGPVRRRTASGRRPEVRLLAASEGTDVDIVIGRDRVAGQVIWLGPVRETTQVTQSSSGGKGVRRSVETTHTAYIYRASLAIGIAEGPIARIGRVWVDGAPFSLEEATHRLYTGTEDQLPDLALEAAESVVPAFRGLAYIVFDDLDLSQFGNRLPQFNFEVERSIGGAQALETMARAVTLIPGSGETAYHTTSILRETGDGVSVPDNQSTSMGVADIVASVDHLRATLPAVRAVSLIVSWFGDDLRAAHCTITPRIERADRSLAPVDWQVAGLRRGEARTVSTHQGSPAYGGTPSDASVREAIALLRAEGQDVVFNPFLLMDIPAGNTLPDPYGGAAQSAYPWRGRITLSDPLTEGTATAGSEVAAFFARYRQMALHYAELCHSAGGVSAFILGSELRGLTQLRDGAGAFPAASALAALAGEVKAILGTGTKVTYAADWSEYGAWQVPGAPGTVLFPLDPLWASPHIDAIGIDNYMPLSDFRLTPDHLDTALSKTPYAVDYLQANIAGGEGFNWFYASAADRVTQTRTPITDGLANEPFLFRVKDLVGWWSSAHHPRMAGARAATPTAYVPRAKPIWFTELGCPAVHFGANQPNVFIDPKSAESALPYFSSGARDDLIQRRFLEAHLLYWQDPAHNPVSPLYGGPMVDPARIFLYTWDARPFPAFPVRTDRWADAPNYTLGHWLPGRAGRIPLDALLEWLAARSGLDMVDAGEVSALVTGYTVSGFVSGREAMEPLLDHFQLDAVERGGYLVIRPRDGVPVRTIDPARVVEGEGPRVTVVRGDGVAVPGRIAVSFGDSLADYRTGLVTAEDAARAPGALQVRDTPLVLEVAEAAAAAAAHLAEAQLLPKAARFALPLADSALECGDVIELAGSGLFRITTLADGWYREVEAVATAPSLFAPAASVPVASSAPAPAPVTGPVIAGAPAFAVLDLPLIEDGAPEGAAFLTAAAFAEPWPGRIAVYRGEGTAPTLVGAITGPGRLGRLTVPLVPGSAFGRWDEASVVELELPRGAVASLDPLAVLAGAGWLAVETPLGSWEVLAAAVAELGGALGRFRLRRLLRGLRGTEDEARAGAALGARVVFLDPGLLRLSLSPDLFGTAATFQGGPAAAMPGAYPYRSQRLTLGAAALRPFSPVHLHAREAEGELTVTFTRRTRIGGDNWSLAAVPLGEASERYQVEGLGADGTVRAMVSVTGTTARLPADGVVAVRVAQLSAVLGPGRAAVLTLSAP